MLIVQTTTALPFPEHLRARQRRASSPQTLEDMQDEEIKQIKSKLVVASYTSHGSDIGVLFDRS